MKKNSSKFDKYYGVQIRQSAICTLKDGRVKTRITVLDPNGKNAHVEKAVIRQTVEDIAADVPKIVEDLIREARPQIVGWLKTGRMDMTLDECLMVFGDEIAAEAGWNKKMRSVTLPQVRDQYADLFKKTIETCRDQNAIPDAVEELTHQKSSHRRMYEDEEKLWIVLGDVCAALKKWGILNENPAAEVAQRVRKSWPTKVLKNLARDALSRKERRDVVRMCMSEEDEKQMTICQAAVLQLYTGMTAAELCGLNVTDWRCDPIMSWLEITREYQHKKGEAPELMVELGNNQYRRIPCTQEEERLLTQILEKREKTSEEALFILDGKRLDPADYLKQINKRLKQLLHDGVVNQSTYSSVQRTYGEGLVSHAELLRATAAYMMEEIAGMTQAEIGCQLGTNRDTTFGDYYCDWCHPLSMLEIKKKKEKMIESLYGKHEHEETNIVTTVHLPPHSGIQCQGERTLSLDMQPVSKLDLSERKEGSE